MTTTLTGPQAVDAFLATVPEPVGALARATVAKVRAIMPKGAFEGQQGNDITFSFGSGYKALMFTVTPQPTLVTLGVADGALLKDMTGLLEGKGKGNRHVRIESDADLKRGALDRLLLEAVKRRKR
ncbi:MAG: hypothetical protein WC876_02750 [Candidatus Thermoplasmatota archaeon]|jgi:hypothetical protein